MIIKAPGLFQHAGQFQAPRPHVLNVSAGGFVPVLKGSFFLGLTPKHLVIAIRVERRVNVNQVNASGREFRELVQVVTAINNAGVHQR